MSLSEQRKIMLNVKGFFPFTFGVILVVISGKYFFPVK